MEGISAEQILPIVNYSGVSKLLNDGHPPIATYGIPNPTGVKVQTKSYFVLSGCMSTICIMMYTALSVYYIIIKLAVYTYAGCHAASVLILPLYIHRIVLGWRSATLSGSISRGQEEETLLGCYW